jgi:hypothetical protein
MLSNVGAAGGRHGYLSSNDPRTVLQEFGRLESADVVLPTADTPSREMRLRCMVRPDKAQAALLDRLGVRLPERLGIPGPAQM